MSVTSGALTLQEAQCVRSRPQLSTNVCFWLLQSSLGQCVVLELCCMYLSILLSPSCVLEAVPNLFLLSPLFISFPAPCCMHFGCHGTMCSTRAPRRRLCAGCHFGQGFTPYPLALLGVVLLAPPLSATSIVLWPSSSHVQPVLGPPFPSSSTLSSFPSPLHGTPLFFSPFLLFLHFHVLFMQDPFSVMQIISFSLSYHVNHLSIALIKC